jgi:DNA-binding MarR family transcriptional regulator
VKKNKNNMGNTLQVGISFVNIPIMQNSVTDSEQLADVRRHLFRVCDLLLQYRRQVEAALDLSAVESDILRFLSGEGDKKMRDVGDAVNVKLSNLTNLIDGLENNKLVRRVASKSDRRAINVEITSKGRKILASYHEQMDEFVGSMRREMSAEAFNGFAAGLAQIPSPNAETVDEWDDQDV